MKKTGVAKPPEDDLATEHRFDYRKARPNRFAARARPLIHAVSLDPDVAEVFATSDSVNAVLRALIATMPGRGSRSNTGRTRRASRPPL